MSDRRPQNLDGVSPHDNTSFASRRPYAPTAGLFLVAFTSTDIITLISCLSLLRLAVTVSSRLGNILNFTPRDDQTAVYLVLLRIFAVSSRLSFIY